MYPKWQAFLANSAKQFFSVNDYETAKYISDYMGKYTVDKEKGKYKIDSRFSVKSKADSIIYPGDCIELLRKIPDDFIQLIITSPPYNNGKPYEDKMSIKEYLDWQKQVISECVRVLKPSGSICWQVGNYYENGAVVPLDILLFPIFKSFGLKLNNRIIWHFGYGGNSDRKLSRRYETILWWVKAKDYVFNLDEIRVPHNVPGKTAYKGSDIGLLTPNPLGANPSDVWNILNVKAGCKEITEHPAQFPLELIRRLVLSMSNSGDCVLDPFLEVELLLLLGLKMEEGLLGRRLGRIILGLLGRGLDN